MTNGLTGLIGAMPEEIAALREGLEDAESLQQGAFVFYKGRLEGRDVLLAQCGIGKVNAAALTQLMILMGVERVIFTGVAGGVHPDLGVGDIVISTDALQHDVDVTALGYGLGQVPGESHHWQADDTLQRLAVEAAERLEGFSEGFRVFRGRVVSGDQFIADVDKVRRLREAFGAVCAEMEGAGVAQVCAKWGVPFVILRSISDSADGEAEVDFREFTPLAASRAERLVRAMLQKL